MVELRRVRVLAPYSRTFYFNELGREAVLLPSPFYREKKESLSRPYT